MERLGVLRTRIGSIAQLHEVVGAMRSLAAVRMQQAADTLAGARRYADIVAAGLSQALLLAGETAPACARARPALLLFSAEHGFVGGYAESLARAAVSAPLVYAVGTRGARALAELGRPPAWATVMTPHAAGIPALARHLAGEIGTRLQAGEFTRLDVMFARLEEGGRWRIVTEAMLPPDFSRFRPPPAKLLPLHHLPAAELLSGLVAEYLLADLVRAATEALAAENAARLQAMTTAADNIDRKLDELRAQERVLRQEQITEELLDVLGGAEALSRG
jgi:F-type H+-transporting ATPase subunit gamma